jgi:hypothetical protein
MHIFKLTMVGEIPTPPYKCRDIFISKHSSEFHMLVYVDYSTRGMLELGGGNLQKFSIDDLGKVLEDFEPALRNNYQIGYDLDVVETLKSDLADVRKGLGEVRESLGDFAHQVNNPRY